MSALNPAAAAALTVSDLAMTDPEYARFFKYFDEEEVAKTVEPVLGKTRRHFVILATLLGCGGKEEFEACRRRSTPASRPRKFVKSSIRARLISVWVAYAVSSTS